MKFKPTHIHKKTGEKVRVLKFFSFTKPKPHVEAMYHRELIYAEPYYCNADDLQLIEEDE